MQGGDDDESTGEESEPDPIDLAALRADDELVEALGAGLVRPPDEPVPPGSEDELVAMLAAWVADVRPEDEDAADPAAGGAAEPAGSSEDPPTEPPIAKAAGSGRHRSDAPSHVGRRFAAAGALLVIASAGLAVGAWEAAPGESLWAVSKVLYAERARSVEAAADVTSGLMTAREALREGRRQDAALAIADARVRLNAVRPDEGREQLASEHARLAAILADSPPAGAVAPPVTSITPVPVGPALASPPAVAGTAAPPTAPATSGTGSLTTTPSTTPSTPSMTPSTPSTPSGAGAAGADPVASSSAGPPAGTDPAPAVAGSTHSSGSGPPSSGHPPTSPAPTSPAPTSSPAPAWTPIFVGSSYTGPLVERRPAIRAGTTARAAVPAAGPTAGEGAPGEESEGRGRPSTGPTAAAAPARKPPDATADAEKSPAEASPSPEPPGDEPVAEKAEARAAIAFAEPNPPAQPEEAAPARPARRVAAARAPARVAAARAVTATMRKVVTPSLARGSAARVADDAIGRRRPTRQPADASDEAADDGTPTRSDAPDAVWARNTGPGKAERKGAEEKEGGEEKGGVEHESEAGGRDPREEHRAPSDHPAEPDERAAPAATTGRARSR